MDLSTLSTAHLRALMRIAKDPARGARPFFRDPYAMIELRLELQDRERKSRQRKPKHPITGRRRYPER